MIMGAGNDTDFLNSDFPMWAAGGVCAFAVYRAYMVRISLNLVLHMWTSLNSHVGTLPSVLLSQFLTSMARKPEVPPWNRRAQTSPL